MKTYSFKVFNNKQTCLVISEKHFKDLDASNRARKISLLSPYKVIVDNGDAFESYLHGEIIEWSYPDGFSRKHTPIF